MKTPVFEHDCDHGCRFLGHWLGHDVYIHTYPDRSNLMGTVIARNGKDGEYSSFPLRIFRSMLENSEDNLIRVTSASGATREIQFLEYMFSPDGSPAFRAILLALAHDNLVKNMEEKNE